MDVTLLYFDDCPNWQVLDARLANLAAEFGLNVRHVRVDTAEEAERVGFRGSPSILVEGRDLFARGDEPVGLSCRVYQTSAGPAGSPTIPQLREALAAGPPLPPLERLT
ncbi:MAG: thioredoxin family protein [Euzebya sp.]